VPQQNVRFITATLATSAEKHNGDVDDKEIKQSAVSSVALLLTLAHNQRRLYVFSHVDPVEMNGGTPNDDAIISRRDVWNEAPTEARRKLLPPPMT